ncbi:transposable element Tcb1 transposase [Trichonephila clavipes]|nr:transposable element Tcb1 transposase [Trichonephila clavipes]
MITNFFIPELNNHDVQELWFQQDGATCHTARATIDLLKDTFGDRLISRFGPVNWPPRPCDLTPLDYFLWGYVKIITHILKKNMQTTGNHQMARIVRHNDESVREGYIRNAGKEVKLFTSTLKAFQCNNCIVMAQRKHLDDFLRGRIIGGLECGRTQLEVSEELGIALSVNSRH